MKICKNCQKDELHTQFGGEYRYCQACHLSYKSRRKSFKKRTSSTQKTCVYFIRSGDLIKIGYTNDINDRMANLQVGNPTKIELLKTIDGGFKEEQELHKKFKLLNKQGEWFYATEELLTFIKSCREQPENKSVP